MPAKKKYFTQLNVTPVEPWVADAVTILAESRKVTPTLIVRQAVLAMLESVGCTAETFPNWTPDKPVEPVK